MCGRSYFRNGADIDWKRRWKHLGTAQVSLDWFASIVHAELCIHHLNLNTSCHQHRQLPVRTMGMVIKE